MSKSRQAGREIGLGGDLLDDVVVEIGPARERDLAGRIADTRDTAHLPVIERRRLGEERQGDVVLIGDDAEQDVAMEVLGGDDRLGERAAHFLDRISGELQHHRHDAVALVLRRLGVAEKTGELDGKLRARLRVSRFDDHIEDADIKPRLASHEKTHSPHSEA